MNDKPLTAREQQVQKLLMRGWENKLIAMSLGISHRTIEDHRAHIYAKRGVVNLVQLIRLEYDLDRIDALRAEAK